LSLAARQISPVEKSTGDVIVYLESRSGFNTLKSVTKNNIIFSEFFYKNNTILCKKWMNRQGHTLFMSKLSVRQNF
jgi:hypothetical protein